MTDFRGTDTYLRGKTAFGLGFNQHECPYLLSDPRRAAWMQGWSDAQTEAKHVG